VAPAPREDDDIVEDYEVLDEQPSRPAAKSGGGKPVLRKQTSVGGKRPSAPVRPGSQSRAVVPPPEPDPTDEVLEEPPAYDPNKGKISSRASMQIWIVCIAITVLGLGAVAVDAIFDPLGRRNNAISNANNKPKNTNKAASNAPKDPVAERAETFKRTVDMDMQRVRNSKAYKAYQAAYYKFREARSNAIGARADEKASRADRQKAWAEVYREYYTVKYWSILFISAYKEGADSGFEPCSLKDEEARIRLSKEKGNDILKPENIKYQAASTLIDAWSSDINSFWSDKKNDLDISDVFTEEKLKPVFKAAKDRFEKATSEPPVFDQADLDSIKE
jgi:hypothetical protein